MNPRLSWIEHSRLRTLLGAIATLLSIPLSATVSQAVFQPLQTETPIPCHHQLTRIPAIPYQCWQFPDPEATLPVWKHSIGFEFGKLTYAQWQTIAIAYTSWRHPAMSISTVHLPPYDPTHHYWLMDFMPPLMQAINRHRFIGQTPLANQTSVLTNCWGTLYEILRLKNASPETPSYLMMVEAETMLKTLKSISTPVDHPQPGDFLLISHRHSSSQPSLESELGDHTYLDHGVLFIDQGLVFEKAGVGDRVPYRLIGLSTLQRIWRQDIYDYHIRRPVANLSLPHPFIFRSPQAQSNWTVMDKNNQYRYSISPLPPLQEHKGRMKLPQEAYNSEYYRRAISF